MTDGVADLDKIDEALMTYDSPMRHWKLQPASMACEQ